MVDKKCLVAFFLLLLAAQLGFSWATHTVQGSPERTVGVKVGDWVKYANFTILWESDDPYNQDPPQDLVNHNNTEWATVSVKAVSGTEITFQTLTHYKNNSETTITYIIDVDTGEGNGSFWFTGVDLIPGATVYDSVEYSSMWINLTYEEVYVRALREVNKVEVATLQYYPEIPQSTVYKSEYHWDKATGVLVGRIGGFVRSTEDYSIVGTKGESILDTNVWNPVPDVTPPTARAGDNQTVLVGEPVSFDAGNSSDNYGGWGIFVCDWDFGDGNIGFGQEITHIYTAPGNYTVTLTVEDLAGNTDEDVLTVTVKEAPQPFPIPAIVLPIVLVAALIVVWRMLARK